jgi:glycyl-tRNA synthetase beta subunit
VNAEDLKVRKNRLTLLKAIKDLYAARIADLSRIRQV